MRSYMLDSMWSAVSLVCRFERERGVGVELREAEAGLRCLRGGVGAGLVSALVVWLVCLCCVDCCLCCVGDWIGLDCGGCEGGIGGRGQEG